MQRIVSGNRNETADARIKFVIARINGARAILTDQPDAQAQYTARVTDPQEYTPDFVMALSLHMAFIMGPHLAKSDEKMLQSAERKYVNYISVAKAQALNEEQPDSLPEASWIAGR